MLRPAHPYPPRKQSAKSLDFERAAEIRDEIAGLKELSPDGKRM